MLETKSTLSNITLKNLALKCAAGTRLMGHIIVRALKPGNDQSDMLFCLKTCVVLVFLRQNIKYSERCMWGEAADDHSTTAAFLWKN